MDPATIAMVTAAVSVAGQISSANAQADSSRSQQNAMNYNATVSNQNASNAMQVSNANEEAQRRKNAALMGDQRAGLLQAGIGTDGSASDVLAQSTKNAEMDALNIRYQGYLKSQAFKNQSELDSAQASAAGQNADNAVTTGLLMAAGKALNSASPYLTNKTK